jgi:hypothetical protein
MFIHEGVIGFIFASKPSAFQIIFKDSVELTICQCIWELLTAIMKVF